MAILWLIKLSPPIIMRVCSQRAIALRRFTTDRPRHISDSREQPSGTKDPILSGKNLINTYDAKVAGGIIDTDKSSHAKTFSTTEIMLDHFLNPKNPKNRKLYLEGLIATTEREKKEKEAGKLKAKEEAKAREIELVKALQKKFSTEEEESAEPAEEEPLPMEF